MLLSITWKFWHGFIHFLFLLTVTRQGGFYASEEVTRNVFECYAICITMRQDRKFKIKYTACKNKCLTTKFFLLNMMHLRKKCIGFKLTALNSTDSSWVFKIISSLLYFSSAILLQFQIGRIFSFSRHITISSGTIPYRSQNLFGTVFKLQIKEALYAPQFMHHCGKFINYPL